jgi:uncharacterized membrane protein (TIGR02234 family)
VRISGRIGLRAGSKRQALVLTVLLGAAGAGLAFLATRQDWAQVRTAPQRPLPASLITVTGAGLVPYSGALVLAGLGCLAAVLATRGGWRRVSGLVLAVLGAVLAGSAWTASRAAVLAAAAATVADPATNPGAGSVTQGKSAAAQVPDLVGATPHVTMIAAGWQAVLVAGALAMVAAGVLALRSPARMAVMGGKYDAPTAQQDSRRRPDSGQPADAASLWEALSRGDDPTAGARKPAGAA